MDTGVKIYREDGQFEVWIGPADDLARDNGINAFIIGLGETKDDALTAAVAELESLVRLCQEQPNLPVTNVRAESQVIRQEIP